MTKESDTKDSIMSGEFKVELWKMLKGLKVVELDGNNKGNLVSARLKEVMERDELSTEIFE
jgi:hypothetical protein